MNALREAIADAEKKNVAIGHFNISEFAALHAIVRAAGTLKVPVIIGTSEGESGFIGIRDAVDLIENARKETGQDIYLNADHFRSVEKIDEAAGAGYDTAIFDAAHLPLEENIEKTKEAVRVAKNINENMLVEGELGYIGTSSKLLDEIPEGAAITEKDMTTPEDARRFVEETGVDLLAPAVGEIHGMMRNAKNPNLDIGRIRRIREAAGVPLVLHGGSGVSDEDFVRAIGAGISIIHINTEIRIAWRAGVEESLKKDPDQIAPYKLLPAAEENMYEVVLKRLKLFNRLI